MTTREIAMATLFVLAGSGAAYAADETMESNAPAQSTEAAEAPSLLEAPAMPSFEAVDADGSGSISTSEAGAVPGLVDSFAVADTDQSGDLSQAEYAALSHT